MKECLVCGEPLVKGPKFVTEAVRGEVIYTLCQKHFLCMTPEVASSMRERGTGADLISTIPEGKLLATILLIDGKLKVPPCEPSVRIKESLFDW